MATTDISEYTSAILSQKKGETVRDAIINAVKVISGAVSGSRSASTLNGEPLTNFVVNYYDPNGDKPFAISLNQTKANMKREVDKINYGDSSLAKQTELGPYSKTGVNNNHYGTHSLDRLEVTRRDIYEAINEAWRNTPSGAHGSDEYLILDSDPFEDYPHYISLIGSGEGYALRCSERTEPITENGTYTADEGTGWTKVTVNVADKNISPHTSTITADGTYTASSYGKDGFSFVNVQVPTVSPDDPTYNPENPYDDKSWYEGGGGSTGSSVYFYRYSGEKYIHKVENVAEGADVDYHGTGGPTVMSKNAGEYFDGWDPEPVNVTHNMKCVAIFKKIKRVEASTGEIQDSWETIAANGGAPYPIGSWKTLDFGTVVVPINERDGIKAKSWGIGLVTMIKIAGANSSKGTKSTWIMDEVIHSPFGSLFWMKETLLKLHNRRFRYVNPETGYFDEFVIGYEDSDVYNFLNGRTPSGGYTANNIYMNLPSALVSKIKSVTKKTVGLVVQGGQSDAYKNNIYTIQNAFNSEKRITTGSHKFWIPSFGEMFPKRFVTGLSRAYGQGSTGAERSAYIQCLFDMFNCGDENYGSFFFGGASSPTEEDWRNYVGQVNGYGTEDTYPWRSSSQTMSSRSMLAEKPSTVKPKTMSCLNRDLAFTTNFGISIADDQTVITQGSSEVFTVSNNELNATMPVVGYGFNDTAPTAGNTRQIAYVANSGGFYTWYNRYSVMTSSEQKTDFGYARFGGCPGYTGRTGASCLKSTTDGLKIRIGFCL